MSGELRGLVTVVALFRATMRNIRQNLVLAFGDNTGAMARSSINVVLNAARLNGFTPPALAADVPPGPQGRPASVPGPAADAP